MKIYQSSTALRLVGKAYEVRWQLRKLAAASNVIDSNNTHTSLAEHLAAGASGKPALSQAEKLIRRLR